MRELTVVLALALVGLAVLRVVLSMRGKTRVLSTFARGATRIVVRERSGFRELAFVDGGSEFVHTRVFCSQPRRSGWPYVDGFHLAALLVPDAKRALFVGCGGGIGPAQFLRAYPSLEIDVVEIDPTVVELAARFFGLEPSTGLKVHIADGAAFLEKPGDAYDLIVLDAYDDGAILPELSSVPFFEHVRDHLSAGGVLCVNLVGATDGAQSGPLREVLSSMATAFGGDATALFAIRGLSETAEPENTEVRRNHLALVARGRSTFPLEDLQCRAAALAILDAPLASAAASWPIAMPGGAAEAANTDQRPTPNRGEPAMLEKR